MVTNE